MTMDKNTYKRLTAITNAALFLVLAWAGWQWGAPWFIKTGLADAKPAMSAACSSVPSCKQVKYSARWNSTAMRYEAHLSVKSTRITNVERKMLHDQLRAAVEAVASGSLLYRANYRAIIVSFEQS